MFGKKSAVSVEVHPTSGAVQKEKVEIEGTGISLRELLKKAGLSDKGMNVTVNGEPAVATTHVPKGAKVKMTEIARGS